MATTKQVLQVAKDLAQALAPLPDAVLAVGTAVDALEAAVTAALAGQTIPAANQKDIDDAFAIMRDTVVQAQAVADNIAKVKVDATDNRDEASVLAASFVDRAEFDTAVAAYRGGQIVNLDGATVKGGEQPVLDYVTDAGGSINLKVA